MSLFTIVIPLFNKERFIEKTMLSILNQTLTDYEILIVDDCSTDKSLDIIRDLQEEYQENKIKIIHNQKNQGVSFSRNKGIKYSKGEYIIFLDADDEFYRDTFLEEINFFLLSYEPEYVMLKRNYYSDYNKPSFKHISQDLKLVEKDFYSITSNLSVAFKGTFPFGGSASSVIRSDIIKNNKFDTEEHLFEDWLFFLPIFLESNAYYFDRVSIKINHDTNSLSNKKNSNPNLKLPKLYHYLNSDKRLKKLKNKFFWIWMAGILKNNVDIIHAKKLFKKYKKIMKQNFVLNKYSMYSIFKLSQKAIKKNL